MMINNFFLSKERIKYVTQIKEKDIAALEMLEGKLCD